jgi:poly-gamma-glutamate capsule biosynthesis protein CapA/YwtB (metallophosphatase superfamily)
MDTVTILAVGDIALASHIDVNPFVNVQSILAQKDILFGNLEVALSVSKKRAKKAHVIGAPPQKAQFLRDAGFDILNVANNHILDLGIEGLQSTLDMLDRCDLRYVGASDIHASPRDTFICKAGVNIGFLGYTIGRFRVSKPYQINKLKRREVLTDIDRLKQKCDLVVVSLHWGTENVHYPSPDQINLAHELIDRGATLVLGHHPHVVQGIEEYGNGLIAYSLGNFNFDPEVSYSKTRKTMILRARVNKTGVKEFQIIPVEINADLMPSHMSEPDRSNMIEFVQQISRCISEHTIRDKWWFEEIAGTYLTGSMRSFSISFKKHRIRTAMIFAIWLFLPFTIRCYVAVLRKLLKTKRVKS